MNGLAWIPKWVLEQADLRPSAWESSLIPHKRPKIPWKQQNGFLGNISLQSLVVGVSTWLALIVLYLKVSSVDEWPYLDWPPYACQQPRPRSQSRMHSCGAEVWGRHYDNTHASNLGCQGNCGLACSYDVEWRKEWLPWQRWRRNLRLR